MNIFHEELFSFRFGVSFVEENTAEKHRRLCGSSFHQRQKISENTVPFFSSFFLNVVVVLLLLMSLRPE